ncbi:MAG: RNA polymerase sigma factor [Lachnospiraceae bacterium]
MDNGAGSYRRFLDGDDNGLRELIDEYYDGLVLYLNTYLRNILTAEELAEDVFALLAIRKPKFGGRSGFKTWLYAIGRNTAVDYIRKEAGKNTLSIEAWGGDASGDINVEAEYIAGEDKKLIHRAMSRLKPEYRQALWLVYFENMTGREVAQVMKRTVASVEHLIRRAKAALKREMEKEGFVYEKS